MASFDVESLFTNVPLHETTELIVNNLNISHLDKFGLDKVHFRKLLGITAHHSVFCFDDCLYTQTDGVAMGPPLGPSYANAFLCHHEQDWLEQCPLEFKPLHYRRYIDDTFLLFKHPSHTIEFFCHDRFNLISFVFKHSPDMKTVSPMGFMKLREKYNNIPLNILSRKIIVNQEQQFLSVHLMG
ncbi:uncharacterized protein [Penaeus vannamei]|uniref:uncharacterized protein n=1 Tax=Penaeus vannamei TaxID=6689 RepID=UPI00387F7821